MRTDGDTWVLGLDATKQDGRGFTGRAAIPSAGSSDLPSSLLLQRQEQLTRLPSTFLSGSLTRPVGWPMSWHARQ